MPILQVIMVNERYSVVSEGVGGCTMLHGPVYGFIFKLIYRFKGKWVDE